MPFGQQSGPPATARQLQALLDLLHEAGHADFRDARGPLGFTQRQAAGRFTRDEADAYIEQLEGGRSVPEEEAEVSPASAVARTPRAVPAPAVAPLSQRTLSRAPSGQLAAELQRRGWMVIEPLEGTQP